MRKVILLLAFLVATPVMAEDKPYALGCVPAAVSSPFIFSTGFENGSDKFMHTLLACGGSSIAYTTADEHKVSRWLAFGAVTLAVTIEEYVSTKKKGHWDWPDYGATMYGVTAPLGFTFLLEKGFGLQYAGEF